MKRLTVLAVMTLVLLMSALPAAAHFLTVTPGGSGEKINWVGGPALPDAAQGAGLMVIGGGPNKNSLQPPSHQRGLNNACEAQSKNRSAASIQGPGPGCPHAS